MKRPSFFDLTADERARFGNGLGPFWLPNAAREFITDKASWFFQHASWRHHDFGYSVGGDLFDRARCDWKFFAAMCKDAISQSRHRFVRVPIALILSMLFYTMVRFFGAFGSFDYRDGYASLDEIRATYLSNEDYSK